MCVKEFLGYICGHCSIPTLIKCPLTSSNPTFQPCKYPAERPKVLRDEELHREQHMAGECPCEVIFDGEDREKRLRPRAGKGKEKAGRKEEHGLRRGEGGGRGHRSGGGHRHDYAGGGVSYDAARGRGRGREGIHYDQGTDGGMSNDSAVASYGSIHQGYAGGAGNNAGFGYGDFGAGGYYNSIISGLEGLGLHGGFETQQNTARQSWDSDAKEAAYQYVGYVVNDAHRGVTVPAAEQGLRDADGEDYHAGHLAQEEEQPMSSQQGPRGMKWYTDDSNIAASNEEVTPARTFVAASSTKSKDGLLNLYKHDKSPPAPKINDKTSKTTKTVPKAFSEPSYTPHQAHVECTMEDSEGLGSPNVVSSDMAKAGH
ncbi:hypothetical protein LSUE1_G005554 [Lachnellula suecica]|uniref:Uncharacterized protein n=1 Tax=Lachnellula suecica TaxID=602035 RepID=A0A8T9C3S3_9HELO|nr:hypothetical protein LSUE1_G005554 [Lachnellula suecica]